MPFIYHYTNFSNRDSILEEGLVYDKKSSGYMYDTGAINNILKEYKPNSNIDRDKCIFLYNNKQKDHYSMFIGFKISIEDLDTSKLFVADYTLAHRIWCDAVDAPYSNEYSGYKLEDTAADYIDSIVPYTEYIKKTPYKKSEYLYFGTIAPERLNILDDRTLFFENLIDRLNEDYEIKVNQKHSLSINCEGIWTSCNYSVKGKEVTLNSYKNTVPKCILEWFETNMVYDNVITKNNANIAFYNASGIKK